MKRCGLLLLLLVSVLAGSASEYFSAKRKFKLIQADTLRAGSRVTLSPRELNAWVDHEITPLLPEGVRSPEVELGNGVASGSALIDFVKVRQAQGKPPSWLLAKLLAGERPVRVTASLQSKSGSATVDVHRVEVSGVPIEGRALDFLIENYLLPHYPDAKVGKPFAMHHRIERIEIKPSAVGIVIGK